MQQMDAVIARGDHAPPKENITTVLPQCWAISAVWVNPSHHESQQGSKARLTASVLGNLLNTPSPRLCTLERIPTDLPIPQLLIAIASSNARALTGLIYSP